MKVSILLMLTEAGLLKLVSGTPLQRLKQRQQHGDASSVEVEAITAITPLNPSVYYQTQAAVTYQNTAGQPIITEIATVIEHTTFIPYLMSSKDSSARATPIPAYSSSSTSTSNSIVVSSLTQYNSQTDATAVASESSKSSDITASLGSSNLPSSSEIPSYISYTSSVTSLSSSSSSSSSSYATPLEPHTPSYFPYGSLRVPSATSSSNTIVGPVLTSQKTSYPSVNPSDSTTHSGTPISSKQKPTYSPSASYAVYGSSATSQAISSGYSNTVATVQTYSPSYISYASTSDYQSPSYSPHLTLKSPVVAASSYSPSRVQSYRSQRASQVITTILKTPMYTPTFSSSSSGRTSVHTPMYSPYYASYMSYHSPSYTSAYVSPQSWSSQSAMSSRRSTQRVTSRVAYTYTSAAGASGSSILNSYTSSSSVAPSRDYVSYGPSSKSSVMLSYHLSPSSVASSSLATIGKPSESLGLALTTLAGPTVTPSFRGLNTRTRTAWAYGNPVLSYGQGSQSNRIPYSINAHDTPARSPTQLVHSSTAPTPTAVTQQPSYGSVGSKIGSSQASAEPKYSLVTSRASSESKIEPVMTQYATATSMDTAALPATSKWAKGANSYAYSLVLPSSHTNEGTWRASSSAEAPVVSATAAAISTTSASAYNGGGGGITIVPIDVGHVSFITVTATTTVTTTEHALCTGR